MVLENHAKAEGGSSAQQQPKAQHGSHQTAGTLCILRVGHRHRPVDHADGATVSVGERKERHDEEVCDVAGKDGGDVGGGAWVVTEQQQRDKDEAQEYQHHYDRGPAFRPHEAPCQLPANVVPDVEQKECQYWLEVDAAPLRVVAGGGHNLDTHRREHGQRHPEHAAHRDTKGPDLPEHSTGVSC